MLLSRKPTLAALTLAAALASAPCAHPRDWEGVRKSGVLQAATEGAFPPFNYFEGARLRGFEVSLAEELARRLGLKIAWSVLPFDSLLIGLNQGRYDFVIASHGITPERARAVDFAVPHYCGGGVVVSRRGGPRTAAQLRGRTVGVQVGTTYFEHLRLLPGVRPEDIKTYPKDSDALQSLLQGRVDAQVVDRFVALASLKAHPGSGLGLGETLFEEKIAGAVAKGNGGLKARIDAALRGMLRDGTYGKLSARYFGEDIRCR